MSALGFGAEASFGGQSNDLIENGFVCWAQCLVRGLKVSNNTGSRYLDLELTISEGQKNERRKLWVNVMDFTFDKNSEGARNMGIAAIQHMLEANGTFRADKPESYAQFDQSGIEGIAQALDQTQVAIRVKVEKGRDGYADRNTVGDWLSPNPKSRSFKIFQALMEKGAHVYGAVPAVPAPQSGFGFAPPAQAPAAPAPTFGTAPAASPAAPAVGGAPAWLTGGQQ
jgi:hypothetical protein